MIIAKIEAFPLRIPFKPGTGAAASARGDKGLPAADSLLEKVTTDKGLEGWGETFGFSRGPIGEIGDRGADRAAVHWTGRNTNWATHAGGAEETPHLRTNWPTVLWNFSGRHRAWDICGKAAGLPVCKLLGRNSTAELTCYASLIRYSDSSLVRANVRRALDSGFRVFARRDRYSAAFS